MRIQPVAAARAGWRRTLAWTLILGDSLVICAAVAVTFSARVNNTFHLPEFGAVPYWVLAVVAILGWSAALGLGGSRSIRYLGTGLEEYRRVVSASLWFFGLGAIGSYVLRASIARSLFVTALPLGVLLLVVFRWLVRRALGSRRVAGQALAPTLLVGSAVQVGDIVHSLVRNQAAGYTPHGV